MVAPTAIPLFIAATWRRMVCDVPLPILILERGQSWNDWGHKTRFCLLYRDVSGVDHDLGTLKILQRDQKTTSLPEGPFERLPSEFCALGQSPQFYDNIVSLFGAELAGELLRRLRDITVDPTTEAEFRGDPGYELSLLRSSEARRAYELRRPPETAAATGPTPQFTFECHLKGFTAPHRVAFEYYPQDDALGRMVAIVGKNATGKSMLLRELANALSGMRAPVDPKTHKRAFSLTGTHAFARVVVVSYSAFDDFQHYDYWHPEEINAVAYYYCGLRERARGTDLRRRPAAHPATYKGTGRRGRAWIIDRQKHIKTALQTIAAMPTEERVRWEQWLDAAQIRVTERTLLPSLTGGDAAAAARALARLSSGHQLIVLLLTSLVVTLHPGTLLLIDEPELHLHPNLLSALMRILHRALVDTGSFAIVATHSPQVLQEIPARSIRILERHADTPLVRAYPRESFGANLGEIADVAFGMSEERKNYRSLLEALRAQGDARIPEILRMPHLSLPLAAALTPRREEP